MSDLNAVEQEDFESCNNSASENDSDVDTLHVEQNEITKTDNTEDPRNQIRESIKCKMYIFLRELSLLFLLAFTYAAFQNNTPKTSKSPNAFPFFPIGSLVKDWYHGQLSEAIELASESDLAFVMYYAPWDAESQIVKHEFDLAAQHMHKSIHFAAINCWQPGSECRQQYSKVYSWPVLMAYPAHGRGIQYRGPKKSEHMLNFLQSVANPLIRLNSPLEISKYQSMYDAVVVGYVNAKLGSSDYGVFYSTALRFLERDPFREVVFLVSTAISTKNPSYSSALHLYLWNETLLYPAPEEWRPEQIISWIGDNLHQVSVWASPPGGKSQSLANYLQPGPALILFTPRNPLYSQIDYYTVLHDVALDYYNCDDNAGIHIKKALLWIHRQEFHSLYKQMKNKCLINKKLKKENFPTVITYDVHKMWSNNTCDYSTKSTNKKPICAEMNVKKESCKNVVYSTPTVLNKESYKIKTKENHNEKDNEPLFFSPEIFGDKNDPKSPKNLKSIYESENCHLFRIAYELQPGLLAPINITMDEYTVNVTGSACKSNKSLSILALDSILYHYFAEGLGIDILNIDDKSAVVILNPASETHYLMKTPFSKNNLERFIFEFTSGALERTLSSVASHRQFTHQYNHKKSCRFNNISKDFCLQELNTHDFLPTVMQPDMAVVVMYYSTKCAFCSGVSHLLLTTARMLHSVQNLQFARIDGDSHSLPWEFAMHHYPSILYFPARRKSESRVFPQNVPITVTNILSFILANSDSQMKIHVMWSVCKQSLFHEDLHMCIRSIKTECMTLIGQILRAYRLSINTHQRTALLKHLQNLRSLHFLLENPSDVDAIQKQVTLLRFVEMVPKNPKRENLF